MSTQIDLQLLSEVASFSGTILEGHLSEKALYHDKDYTAKVVEMIRELAQPSGLSVEETVTLQLAVWFQNTGFSKKEKDYAAESRRISRKFLVERGAQDVVIKKVDGYLSFLQEEKEPHTLPEKILSDASLVHLSQKNFISRLPLLRKETQIRSGTLLTKDQWYQEAEKRLMEAEFFTSYARDKYSVGLADNRALINKKRKKYGKKVDERLKQELRVDDTELKELKKKLRKVDKRPERGIETMFRLASKNHFTLNEMVDKKSSILISINSIILSIVIGTVMKQLSTDPHLVVPVIMIATTNLWSIVLAVFATRPEKTHGKSIPGEATNETTNLLFYGNFHQMTEEEYLHGIDGLMNDGDRLYSSLSRDVYYLGKHLERKFSLLRRSFNIFVIGFIASVVTFIFCHLFFGGQSVMPLF